MWQYLVGRPEAKQPSGKLPCLKNVRVHRWSLITAARNARVQTRNKKQHVHLPSALLSLLNSGERRAAYAVYDCSALTVD